MGYVGWQRNCLFYLVVRSNSDTDKFVENTVKMAQTLLEQEEYRKGLKVLMRIWRKVMMPVYVAAIVVQTVGKLKNEALAPEEEEVVRQLVCML